MTRGRRWNHSRRSCTGFRIRKGVHEGRIGGVPRDASSFRPAGSAARVVLPVVNRTFAEDVLARATVVLCDVRAEEGDHEDAARAIQALLVQACPSERDLSNLISALGRGLDVHGALRRVLLEIQRLGPAHVVERAGFGVARLMAQAHQAGDHEALGELLLIALEDVGPA